MKKFHGNNMTEPRFIRIPMALLSHIIVEKKSLGDIIEYGFYITAMAQDVSLENAVRQVLYIYITRESAEEEMPKELVAELDRINEDIGIYDEDYRGFMPGKSGGFEPLTIKDEEAIPLLNRYCETHPAFAKRVKEFHLLRQAAELFGVSINYRHLAKIHEKFKDFDNSTPFAFANLQILLDYRDSIDTKDSDDIAVLLMYLAYKSIVGNKPISKAPKELVLARMVGASRRDEVEKVLKQDRRIEEFYVRYSSKDTFLRIRGELLRRHFVTRVERVPGRERLGTFATFADVSDEDFSNMIQQLVEEERKEKTRLRVAKYRARNRREAIPP